MSWVLGTGPTEERLRDKYKIGQELGKGAFGIVYSCVDKSGKRFACKSISKAKLVTKEDRTDVKREVEVLKLVSDHPNVAELHDVYEDANFVYLVLELCEGGELFDRIISSGTFTEKKAASYFGKMVEVVDFCHQLGVMHRDIKPENFLMADRSEGAALKLCDFGLSSYIKPNEKLSHIAGSAYYVAPEVLRRCYSVEADMWSLGVMLYILLSGLPPFWGDTEEDIFKMVLKGEVDFQTPPWPSLSPAARDCVKQLLTVDASKRASAQHILEHPWLKAQGAALDHPLDSIVLTRMRKFAAMNKLKKAALLCMAKTLSPADITGLGELFRSIDRDNSGTLTVDELRQALTTLDHKIQDSDLREAMAAADLDGDGLINYEEFICATVNLNKLEVEQHYMTVFKEFDTDGSGALSTGEIRHALARLGVTDGEVQDLLEAFDTNHDNEIDYPEFLALMREKYRPEAQEASAFFRHRNSELVSSSLDV